MLLQCTSCWCMSVVINENNSSDFELLIVCLWPPLSTDCCWHCSDREWHCWTGTEGVTDGKKSEFWVEHWTPKKNITSDWQSSEIKSGGLPWDSQVNLCSKGASGGAYIPIFIWEPRSGRSVINESSLRIIKPLDEIYIVCFFVFSANY